ncbi:hypothetical protein VRZ08_05090 [Rhodopseudomonas sp. G2_2311]|uniref:hypothetical protein n=1 Tax=Rhodopseudomonas sp. G2_2311 TaxID=3114287 RepID=UPI0039C618F8
MTSDESDEPDGESRQLFFMAPDHLGHWVVQDRSCSRSGYFTNREWAQKFALSENGRRPDLIVELPEASALIFRQVAFHNSDASKSRAPSYRKAA